MIESDAFLGVRVLDMSRVLAGPFTGMLLADMGAEVIKLEIPGKGDDSRQFPPFIGEESMYYVNLNRGKESITLNLKTEEGKEVFKGLVRECDILLENFRPGAMDRLGLGYEDLSKINPELIYAAISGFGQTGPYKTRPGYDIIGQAMGGLLSITGWPDGPPTRSGTAIGDILSSLFCTIGILAALKVREQTGMGQLVDVALVDSVFAALENIPQMYYVNGHVPERIGNRYEFIYPYDTFRTKDGWVVIGIANDSLWVKFLNATGLGLGDDLRFKSNPDRVKNHAPLKLMIEEWTAGKTKNEVVDIMTEHGIPGCPIYDIKEASEDPHILGARKMVLDMEQPGLGNVKVQGNPIKMSLTNPRPRGPAPSLGGNTFEVLKRILGLTEDQFKELQEKGAV
ncbi:CoA transferase [Candidatus Bathyarchaeota archaeon]|jgi:crotonobetainyl-CoA:carnitine CoA-transferase CaiB-like acyl-CoA transferase|nr:CoA transferase [Candidatus Bathyarchaeota archaeon]MBT4320945.1 CoA transferase [Candidatus Bathyarchaeota archaeon]MBT4424732.1 CoA transferase [Candidatus Bathyarchaeota archaeon]MBT6604315.1 CoA transferase [Candidatus Bathyarchaeota archaeon]MBT7187158.1 CoA transferase [Candidatus Bathyarchaeota archaeon]